jgi:crotonobetainyl-CoA:carnitine CoA-transferase CaiB-like acyl-CoA transferase
VNEGHYPLTEKLLRQVLDGLGIDPPAAESVTFSGDGAMLGYFAYTDMLAATLAAAGVAVAELVAAGQGEQPRVHVDRVLASGWARNLMRPLTPPPQRRMPFRIGGEYRTADGRWLRMTDANQRLQQRMLAVLGTPPDLAAVTAEISRHNADDLERALLDGGGAAAASRTMQEWAAHPAGQAIAAEPLTDVTVLGYGGSAWRPAPGRPLAGIRVLDCTRAIAGPMATRLLAGFGAEVLRVDPAGYAEWDDRDATQLTLGKRCTSLDLADAAGRERFLRLLADADVFVHGYRPGVFDQLGLGEAVREQARPDLIEVTHNAYGWTGPWAGRRGFDSTVFVSSGLLHESMRRGSADTPAAPGIVQHIIVDHCVGHVAAASVVRALTRRLTGGSGSRTRLSLAGNTRLLGQTPAPDAEPLIPQALDGPFEDRVYNSIRGPVRRLMPPLSVAGQPFFWERPGEPYGSAEPLWATEPVAARR